MSLQKINPADSDRVELLQITDSHIFADPTGRLLNMNTRKSFEAVCHHLVESKYRADALLATGDLSQDGSAESYQYLAHQFNALGFPTFWIPGNHDDPLVMGKNLISGKISAARRLLVGHWQIILLDSTIKNEVGGRVSETQQHFLDTALKEHSEKHALVCLHHQAREIGSQWLDQKGLKDSARFRKLLSRHRNLKAVLWGHVHQQSDTSTQGVEWMSTPSTCVQFTPASKEFSVSNEPPGYRRLTLFADGRIESEVLRVTDFEVNPDQSSRGY